MAARRWPEQLQVLNGWCLECQYISTKCRYLQTDATAVVWSYDYCSCNPLTNHLITALLKNVLGVPAHSNLTGNNIPLPMETTAQLVTGGLAVALTSCWVRGGCGHQKQEARSIPYVKGVRKGWFYRSEPAGQRGLRVPAGPSNRGWHRIPHLGIGHRALQLTVGRAPVSRCTPAAVSKS